MSHPLDEFPIDDAPHTGYIEDFGTEYETKSARLARLLAEADIDLIDTLRMVREHRGLKQEDLGRLMGVSQATVSAFESGASEPKLSTIRRYAHALDVLVVHSVRPQDDSLSTLFTWTAVTEFAPLVKSQGPTPSYKATAYHKRTDFALAG